MILLLHNGHACGWRAAITALLALPAWAAVETNLQTWVCIVPPRLFSAYCSQTLPLMSTNREARAATDAALKRYLEDVGMSFPLGSSVHYEEPRMTICNTEQNLELLMYCLPLCDVGMAMAEIDGSYLAFPSKDIEAAARREMRAAPSADEIKALWRKGEGRLLTTAKVITRSGVNAIVRGVTEILYPTEFERCAVADDSPGSYHPALPPGAFETREVGVLLNVTPIVWPDGHTMSLTLEPETVEPPGWDDWGPAKTLSDGKETSVSTRVPRFRSRSVKTTVILWDGETAVLGGYPSDEGKETVYLFLSVRLVDFDGRPIHPRPPSSRTAGGK